MQPIFFIIHLLIIIPILLANGNKDGLTQIELRAKYGQGRKKEDVPRSE